MDHLQQSPMLLFTPPAPLTTFFTSHARHAISKHAHTGYLHCTSPRHTPRIAAPTSTTTPTALAGRSAWPVVRFLRNFLFFTPLGKLMRKPQAAGEDARSSTMQEARETVLVTGASGGTGRRVVQQLLRQKRCVRALTRSRERLHAAMQAVDVDMAEAERNGLLEVVVSDFFNVPDEALFDVTQTINCVGTKTGPTDDDADRSKYYQGIVQYPPVILEDSPKNVELLGVTRLTGLLRAEWAHTEGTTAGKALFDFSDDEKTRATWGILDDVVMGGVSASSIRTSQSYLVFSGTVSTDNSGGFASSRTTNFTRTLDLSASTGLQMRCKGDGLRYKLIMRCDGQWDGIAYCYSFDTTKGEWGMVNAPFAEFRAVKRGRTVVGAPKLDGTRVVAVQLMVSKFEYDGELSPHFRAGHFQLVVGAIRPFSVIPPDAAGRPRFVHLSTAAVTRPLRMAEIEDTPAHVPIVKLNEQIGRLLNWKLAGEDAIRGAGIPYTIVRSTALTLQPARGVAALCFDQGDLLTGRVSRDDIAELLVQTLDVPRLVGMTFEVATAGENSEDGEQYDVDVVSKLSLEEKAQALDKDDVQKREFALFPYMPAEDVPATESAKTSA